MQRKETERGEKDRGESYVSCCEDWGEIALGYVEARKRTEEAKEGERA